jgi:ubiquinone/menaquinone biosynthesis C-methylase UbiE
VSTREEWDASAEWFDQNMGEHGDPLNREALRSLVLEWLGDTTGAHVFDCGCGSGYLAAEIASRAAHVTATDFAPSFLEVCRRKHAAVSNLEFTPYDVTDTCPLADESVDAVLSKMVLQYVPEIHMFAAEAARVLKPDGRLIVLVDHPFHAQVFAARARAGVPSAKYHDLGDYFDGRPRRKLSLWGRVELTWYPRTLTEYVETFLAAGFRLDTLREVPFEEEGVALPRVLGLRFTLSR